jgi:signal transduction histidine kinase
MRTIEKASKDYEVIKSALDPIIVERLKLKPADSVDGMHSEHPMFQVGIVDPILFDRLKLKSKVATDSIRNIQKYAQVLLETSIMNLNKDSGDLNRTIQSVIKYLVPMKKFGKVVFRTEFNTLPPCNYDSEQIQHLFVQLFTNSAEAKSNATILIRSFFENNKVQIIVEDDGPGFPPGNKNSFLELPSSNRSGYGLFLCKSIIDRHNGQIKILDKEKGASIQISLPV